MSKSVLITLRDVARECGCSPATVSIALNGAPLARFLAPETRKRINQAARRLNYRPNPWARLLHEKRSGLLGVVALNLASPEFVPILRGIESSLHSETYLPVLVDSDSDPNRFAQNVEVLCDRRVEGLVLITNGITTGSEFLVNLTDTHLPVVVVGREIGIEGMSTVSVNGEMAARSALTLLHALGHREIAFICGPKTTTSREWWRGVLGYAQEARVELKESRMLEVRGLLRPELAFEDGVKVTMELLRRRCPFTALMTCSDATALGAIHALRRRGVQVPEECSVMGFDDIPQARTSVPTLSTVRWPMESVGSIGIKILLEAIRVAKRRGNLPVVKRKVPATVVMRESVTGVRATKQETSVTHLPDH